MQIKIENNDISYIHEPSTPNLSYIMAMPFPPTYMIYDIKNPTIHHMHPTNQTYIHPIINT